MKLRLLAIGLIITTSACKKDYSYEAPPKKQLCYPIMGKDLINGVTPFFMLGDGAMGWGADLIVSREDYDKYKVGEMYCNTPTCGILNEKYMLSGTMPTFTFVDTTPRHNLYGVTMHPSQADYDKYKLGDLYCY